LGDDCAGGCADDDGRCACTKVIYQESGEGADTGTDDREHESFGH
jgi:hypothetical protein